MWYKTRVTEILGIDYPIIQGPFGGGLSSTKLLSLVSNAGGLGSFGLQTFSPDQILEIDKEIRQLTHRPYALNLWVSNTDARLDNYTAADYDKVKAIFRPYFEELGVPLPGLPANYGPSFEQQMESILRVKPPVFSFVFGVPSREIMNECKKAGIKTMGTATTPDEALALEAGGVDIVVATGFEAGGHRVSFLRPAEESLTGSFALLPQVADKIKIPVVAAGGIADGRGVVAAMTLGAEAVQVGTAFLACQESNATDMHRHQLFSPSAKYTTLTNAFSGRLARGITSRLSEATKDRQKEMAPFPLQSYLLRELRAAAIAQQKTDTITFWSGQNAPLIRHTSALALFESLIQETSSLLQAR